MAKPTNPFFDFDPGKMPDFAKMLVDMKVPGMDMEAIAAGQRRTLEALTAANQVVVEGMQAVAKRQAEILRETMEEAGRSMRDLMAAGSPEEKAARQADLAKSAFNVAVTNMRELAEMVAKSNSEALDVINKRVMESLDEFKVAVTKKPGRPSGA